MQRLTAYDKLVFERLERSGIAANICSSKGRCELPYSRISMGMFSSKHRDVGVKEGAYYNFVKDDIKHVIELVAGPTEKYRILPASKKMIVDEKAVELFRQGWGRVKS